MRSTSLLLCLAITALATTRLEAAPFSSTRSFADFVSTSFRITSYRNNAVAAIGQHTYDNVTQIKTGMTSAKAVVDTTSGLGRFESMQLAPLGLNPSAVFSTFSTSVTGLIGNFPDPPQQQTIQGTWTEAIKIDSIVGLPPTLDLVSPKSLETNEYVQPWYVGQFPAVLKATPFTINGVYQVVGPKTNRFVPFSVAFEPTTNGSYATLAIKSTSSLGDGFEFRPTDVLQQYTANNEQIFSGSVDGVYFGVRFETAEGQLDPLLYFSTGRIPEPTGGSMAIISICLAALARRDRRGIEPREQLCI